MLVVLILSLLANAALGALVGLRLAKRRAWRRRKNDFAALGAARFSDVQAGRVGLVGDSQAQDAPLLELLSGWRQYGIGGATIRDVASWIGLAHCDELVIMAGTNDVLLHRPIAESIEDARRLLDLVRRPVSWVAVPLADAGPLNAALHDLVESRGGRWVDADLGPDWTDDGAHLNRQAYTRLFTTLPGTARRAAPQ